MFSRISGLNNRVNPNPRGLWTKEPILILNENVIFNVHLMIIKSVTHVFIKQILRAAEQEPPPPFPTELCKGCGWLYGHFLS
jgi:hypothetical protein